MNDAADLSSADPPAWLTSLSAKAGEPMVATPRGAVPRRCIVEILEADEIDMERGLGVHVDGTRFEIPECEVIPIDVSAGISSAKTAGVQAPVPDGWIENANALYGPEIRKVTATWRVPTNPVAWTNQLIYLFPALEPADGSGIFQPVLQYGNNGAWGGQSWNVTSWIISGGRTVISPEHLSAATNDLLYGVIQGASCSTGCDWWVTSHNLTRGTTTSARMPAPRNLRWVFGGALEIYHLNGGCNSFPGDVAFDNIGIWDAVGIRHVPSAWTHNIAVNTGCGQAVFSDGNTVDLTY